MQRRLRAACMVAAVCALGAAQAEQTLESVETEVEALWQKVDAFTMNVTTDTNVPVGPLTLTSRATGTMECAKKDGAVLFRLEMVNKTQVPVVGAVDQKMLNVFDGTAMFSEMEMPGMHKVFRMPKDAAQKKGPSSGRAMFEGFREQGEVKLLPDATVDGAPVWVVQVTPNEAFKRRAPTPVALFKFYISKDSGIQIKTEIFDTSGKPTSTTVCSNVNTGAKPAPERFVYTAPPGVTVEELRDGQLPGL